MERTVLHAWLKHRLESGLSSRGANTHKDVVRIMEMLGFELRQRPLPREGAPELVRAWHWRFGMDERQDCKVEDRINLAGLG